MQVVTESAVKENGMSLAALRFATFVVCLALAAGNMMAKDKDKDQDKDDEKDARSLLEWKVMVGVPRPYTGTANAIRGVAGGGVPWVIRSGKGELTVDGHLEVNVKGLVIDPNDPAAMQAGLAGQNPLANFRAIVSCLSKDAAGNAVTSNIMTDQFPATVGFGTAGGGDAKIEADIMLPKPCIAPIVFVGSPGGAWFAATGN